MSIWPRFILLLIIFTFFFIGMLTTLFFETGFISWFNFVLLYKIFFFCGLSFFLSVLGFYINNIYIYIFDYISFIGINFNTRIAYFLNITKIICNIIIITNIPWYSTINFLFFFFSYIGKNKFFWPKAKRKSKL